MMKSVGLVAVFFCSITWSLYAQPQASPPRGAGPKVVTLSFGDYDMYVEIAEGSVICRQGLLGWPPSGPMLAYDARGSRTLKVRRSRQTPNSPIAIAFG